MQFDGELRFSWYYYASRSRHPEIPEEWIARVLVKPTRSEIQGASTVYWRHIKERGRWLKVVVENGRVHNSYIDGRNYTREWEIPDEDR